MILGLILHIYLDINRTLSIQQFYDFHCSKESAAVLGKGWKRSYWKIFIFINFTGKEIYEIFRYNLEECHTNFTRRGSFIWNTVPDLPNMTCTVQLALAA